MQKTPATASGPSRERAIFDFPAYLDLTPTMPRPSPSKRAPIPSAPAVRRTDEPSRAGPANDRASAIPGRQAVHYRIEPVRPEAHRYAVECAIRDPNPAGEAFVLPAWIPGSYMIRDFAKHVLSASAEADGQDVPIRKVTTDRWVVVPPSGTQTLRVRIEVYAWDLSVRGAHLDDTHGFFNGTSVFLRVEGRESHACIVELVPPATAPGWRVATTLPRAGATPTHAFGHYQAANYAELIDHPVETGTFELIEFAVRGVRHEVALTGVQRADPIRLARDLKKICAWQLDFWGRPFPVARYLFLVTCVGDGYGGLEHRASTALLCRRDDLPRTGDQGVTESYRRFLGLASHEYFHTWLVKRILPAEYSAPGGPDLQRAQPTELLWLFEGFTAYYDDLALMRSGVISVEDYLACLQKTVGDVAAAPGRFRQSVAEASYDAWIKYYRPDENTANATISYYAKGALVAMALDLTIREATGGKRALDDVMRRLWQEHGLTGRGVAEDDVRRIVADVAPALSGKKLAAFFRTAVHGTGDLPIRKLLAGHGVTMAFDGEGEPSLGIRIDPAGSDAKIACAFEDGAAQRAGLSGGDVLVAIDGLRATAGNIDRLLAGRSIGDTVSVHAFRRDELRTFDVVLGPALPRSCRLTRDAKPGKTALNLRDAWLKAD
jgi:predicted metalloprotease with PDZ domain